MAVGARAATQARPGARRTRRRGERRTPTGRRLRAVAGARSRRRIAPFLLVASMLVGSLVLAVATLQALVAQTSFEMDDLTRRQASLREEQGRLRLEVAQLSSPKRIAAEARRLGLELPAPGAVKTLRVQPPPGRGPG
ncbi:MAG: hypothetical protein ABR518_10465 [Actinomycetota bacterium]